MTAVRAIGIAFGLLCLVAPPAVAAGKYDADQVASLVEVAAAEKEPEGRRAQAIRQLANTDVRTHLSTLRRLLREERSLDIRLSAACTLAALGDRNAPRDLLFVSAYDASKTPNVTRTDVLLALGRMGDPAAEMHFERALLSDPPADEPYFLTDGCRSLANLNTAGSRLLLLKALRDGKPPLRLAAINALSGLALQKANPDRAAARAALVNTARTDLDESVAEQAASALLWSGVDGAAFFKMLESEPNAALRMRAAKVMNRHYLPPPRLSRLQKALAKENELSVKAAMQATVDSQKKL
jgi:HEAT repeat protein